MQWDENLSAMTIDAKDDIAEAMGVIDRGAVALALLVDAEGHLLGTLSDGDLRRALLSGARLSDPAAPHVNRKPVVARPPVDRAGLLDLMTARRLAQIPEVDGDGRLIRLHLLQRIIGGTPKSNPVVILAGGFGRRLEDLTKDVPKPMLPVAGRPILERLVLHLVGSGLTRLFLSVGYLADQIMDHFGSGEEYGCHIAYLCESPERPLGTGGPVGLMREHLGDDEPPLLVINGDLLTSFSADELLAHHRERGAHLTMGLTDYIHEVPFGVPHLTEEGYIQHLDEKPTWHSLANAGIYALDPSLVDRIPLGEPYSMTTLIHDCLDRGDTVSGWTIRAEWQDIGLPAELAKARGVQ